MDLTDVIDWLTEILLTTGSKHRGLFLQTWINVDPSMDT